MSKSAEKSKNKSHKEHSRVVNKKDLENENPPADSNEQPAGKKIKVSASPDKKMEELEQKLKQALEDNLYLRADFENFKKRLIEERQKFVRYGSEQLIASLANEVLDDLDRAMSFAKRDQSFDNLKKGLDVIQKKISQVLNQFGVQVVDPTGEAFDPSSQEALSHVESSEIPEGHVAETFKKIYKLHDKVIRPAQVVLAKKKKEN